MSLPAAGLTRLTDSEILAATVRAAADERAATVYLIALLAELDTRRLYLGQGCSSLFTYCTRVLHLSEHAAYGRIEAARCTRRIPAILDLLADGGRTDVDNLALRCRAHNQHEAERWFGPWQAREVRPAYYATRAGPS